MLPPRAQNDNTSPLPEGLDRLSRHISANDFPGAIRLCRDLIRETPNNPLLHNIMGVAQAQLGQTTVAIKALRRAVEIEPYYAEAIGNLIALLIKDNQHTETKPYVLKALELEPHNLGLRQILAEVLFAEDNPQGAREQANMILLQQPGDANAKRIKDLANKALEQRG
jgi:Flp pilus assembly protein TadD